LARILFTRCPACHKNGNDRAGDNLAIYPDGSKYCFRCGYYQCKNSFVAKTEAQSIPKITLPDDCNTVYPAKIIDWIASFDLSKNDLLFNGVLWSDGMGRLIFPFWMGSELIGYQARSIKKDEKIKWLTKGNIKEKNIIYFNGKVGHAYNKASALFLVEDIISAIKLSKLGVYVMPLFGVNFKPLQLLKLQFKEYIIFLDENMHEYSIKKARQISHYGIKCSTILSKCDPKLHTCAELNFIKENFYEI